jgi:acetolactate synthase-1/2/3 large subunit
VKILIGDLIQERKGLMKLNGSEILVECLKEQGVDSIFGYPGGAVLNIYDALYKYSNEITHYLTSHEQGAAHAADGYARSTGKVGVCLATSGPGSTNMVTGIATAYMDSVPMVAITGNVTSSLLGKDSFQEVDILGITMPITKHSYIVKDISELADTIREAFYIAQSGRPGPVLVDITKDVTAAEYEYKSKEPTTVKRVTELICQDDLREVADIIDKAEKPLVFAGGGVVIGDATEELLALVEKIDAPVSLSTMALSGFPTNHKNNLGMIGMHGSRSSNLASKECDVMLAIGTRFSDRVISNVKKFAPNAKIIHIDVDPSEINKNVNVCASVIGDVKVVLQEILHLLKETSHKPWMDYVQNLKQDFPVTYKKDGKLKPQYILEKVSEISKGNAIVATEVGQHQMWACQYIELNKPRTFLTSGGLGTMGYGLGASIGASVANPDKTVFNIAGDGCFRMNNTELSTAVEYNLPIIVIIINNHVLGMVHQWQDFFYDSRFSHTELKKTTDFVKLAEAHNAAGFNVTRMDEVETVLKKAVSLKCPVVINFEVEEDEKVFPMVPSGAGIDEFVPEKKLFNF